MLHVSHIPLSYLIHLVKLIITSPCINCPYSSSLFTFPTRMGASWGSVLTITPQAPQTVPKTQCSHANTKGGSKQSNDCDHLKAFELLASSFLSLCL